MEWFRPCGSFKEKPAGEGGLGKPQMRRFLSSVIAVALVLTGASLMILFDHHTLAVIWNDPASIFWSNEPRQIHAGPYWFIGPLLIFAGAAVIAEDWFGFGRQSRADLPTDSALRSGTTPDAPGYEQHRLERPPSTTSRS